MLRNCWPSLPARAYLVVRLQHSHPIWEPGLRMLESKNHQQVIIASGALLVEVAGMLQREPDEK
jgi:hypothetical protein